MNALQSYWGGLKTQKETDVSLQRYISNPILVWKRRPADPMTGPMSPTHSRWRATIRTVPGVSEKHQGNSSIWVCVAVGWPRRLDISLNSCDRLPWQHRLNWIQGTYVCLWLARLKRLRMRARECVLSGSNYLRLRRAACSIHPCSQNKI